MDQDGRGLGIKLLLKGKTEEAPEKALRGMILLPWLAWLLAFISGPVFAVDADLERFEFRRPLMGMTFRIVLFAKEGKRAQKAASAAFDRVKQLNSLLSDYEPESELNRLCKTAGTGRKILVSNGLWTVLEAAQKLACETEGAFDVSAGPHILLWRRARRRHELPSETALKKAAQKVGYDNIQLNIDDRSVELKTSGMQLDLGGIAKGFALDESFRVLRKMGFRQALIVAGGDMRAGAPPPGKAGWKIALADLASESAAGNVGNKARFMLLQDTALATSGDLFQFVEIAGVRYSHIVDPRTGIGLTPSSLVHVIAPTGMEADSLATAISVLGPEAGLELIQAREGSGASITRLNDKGKVEIVQSAIFKDWPRH